MMGSKAKAQLRDVPLVAVRLIMGLGNCDGEWTLVHEHHSQANHLGS